ncbi:MAG: ABC transporter [Methanobacteriota archaeon]|nr:MAG: ABC transporter [Euryarchaeota archaeon]
MMRGAAAIFTRDFKKFMSNPFVLLMTLFMPIMYLVIFGNAMGGTISHIPIGVVQGDPYVDETPLFTTAVSSLAHYQQRENPPVFDVTVFTSEDIAKKALSEGRVMAVVVFPSALAGDHTVRLYVDSSDYMVPTVIEAGVSSVLLASGSPVTMQVDKIYGEMDYIQFFGVGVIVMGIFMSTMMGGGLALIRDREMGIIEGYLVTPVKRSSIILGIIGSGTIKALLSGTIIFLVDIFVAGVIVRTAEDFLLVLVVLFIISVGITSLVVSLSSRFRDQQSYASSIAFLNLILFMTSGAFYPTIGMPGWLRWITVINPEAYAIHALRSIILRSQGIGVIWLDLLALGFFSAAAIGLGILTYQRTIE